MLCFRNPPFRMRFCPLMDGLCSNSLMPVKDTFLISALLLAGRMKREGILRLIMLRLLGNLRQVGNFVLMPRRGLMAKLKLTLLLLLCAASADAPPPTGLIPSCSEGGVFGALGGVVGSTQSLEALKELLGIGNSLSGYLLIYDGLDTTWRKVRVKPDPNCPLCGKHPRITDLSGHSE